MPKTNTKALGLTSGLSIDFIGFFSLDYTRRLAGVNKQDTWGGNWGFHLHRI